MATKTFEELRKLAIQIRDEKANKQNTALRIGNFLLSSLDKMESMDIADIAEAVLQAETAADEAKRQADIVAQSGDIVEEAIKQGTAAEAAAAAANAAADKATNEGLFKTQQDLSEEEQGQVKRNLGVEDLMASLETQTIEGFSETVNATTSTKSVDNIIPPSIDFAIVDLGSTDGRELPTTPSMSVVLAKVTDDGRVKMQGYLKTSHEEYNIQVVSGSAEKYALNVNIITDTETTYKVFQIRYLSTSDGGKFKGSYGELSQLQSAYPTAGNGSYAFVGNPRHLYEWVTNAWTDRGEFITNVDQAIDAQSERAIANKAVAAKLTELETKMVDVMYPFMGVVPKEIASHKIFVGYQKMIKSIKVTNCPDYTAFKDSFISWFRTYNTETEKTAFIELWYKGKYYPSYFRDLSDSKIKDYSITLDDGTIITLSILYWGNWSVDSLLLRDYKVTISYLCFEDCNNIASKLELEEVKNKISILDELNEQTSENTSDILNVKNVLEISESQKDVIKLKRLEQVYLGTSGKIISNEASTTLYIDIFQVKKGGKYNISGTYITRYCSAACFDEELKENPNDVISNVLSSNKDDMSDVNIVYIAPSDGYIYLMKPFILKEVFLDSERLDRLEHKTIKTIICPGDSLTAGAGATNNTKNYVSLLRNKLSDEYQVINCGHGGQKSNEISSRLGGLQPILKVTTPITLPAKNDYVVIASFNKSDYAWEKNEILSDNKKELQLLQGGDIGTNENYNKGTGTVTILGQTYKYALYGENHTAWGSNSTKGEYTLIANVQENYVQREISTDIPLAYQSAKEFYDCYAQIIFIGANGGFDDADNLCYQVNRMIERSTSKRFIVLSLHIKQGTSEEVESAYLKEFGVNYLNLRDYFSKYAMDDAVRLGLLSEITEQDRTDMSNGTCPRSLLADTIHFNDVGYELLANLVYQKGLELGYW